MHTSRRHTERHGVRRRDRSCRRLSADVLLNGLGTGNHWAEIDKCTVVFRLILRPERHTLARHLLQRRPSCSNTAFNVTTGVAAALGLGAGAMGFDLAACRLFGDRLSGRGFLAGGRAGGHGDKLACGGDTDANYANRPPGKGDFPRPRARVEHHQTSILSWTMPT